MKIVIANGTHAADYVLQSFKKNHKHHIIVINSNRETASYLATSNNIPVFFGNPSRRFVLENAHIEEADIFIALGDDDSENFVSCMLAKKAFNAKKTICIVSNPKRVETFRSLGIDSVISSTALLTSSIVNESSIEEMIKAVTIEDEKISMIEVVVKDSYRIARHKLMDISFPKSGTISCIYRRPNVIIPNGSTVILPKDKLVVVCITSQQDEVIKFIQKTE